MNAKLERVYLHLVVWLNRKAKSAAVRLTHLTGKSPVRMHPKHLVPAGENQAWYLHHITPGKRVLDVGSSTGVHSRRAAQQASVVVGMEYLWRDLQTARALNDVERVSNVAFLMDNVEQGLAVADKQFDLVMFLDVIEHLHRRVNVLREIGRVLRADGILLISAPNRATRWKSRLKAAGLFYYTDPDHKIEYTWDEMLVELRAGGFEPVGNPVPIVYDTPWAGLIDLVGGFSLSLYQRLLEWKTRKAQEQPEEAIGWRFVCRRIAEPVESSPWDSTT
jgi:2-polyprenyl-3-methyl-5-hydroxy-6-metoxy-1,4-benzoquinol methylase